MGVLVQPHLTTLRKPEATTADLLLCIETSPLGSGYPASKLCLPRPQTLSVSHAGAPLRMQGGCQPPMVLKGIE